MQPHSLRPWNTLSKKTILEYGRFLKVEEHTVQLPDGRVIPDWSWVIIPDAAIVLVRTRESKFLSFRQTKYALEGITLAPVAGMLNDGEDPLAGAKRELLEETGYKAVKWTLLGSYRLDPNRGVNTIHLFLAQDAYQAVAPQADDLEDQELIFLDKEELEQALFRGDFKALMWAAVVSIGLQFLDS